jgi:hypothetical protein
MTFEVRENANIAITSYKCNLATKKYPTSLVYRISQLGYIYLIFPLISLALALYTICWSFLVVEFVVYLAILQNASG